MAVVIVDGNPGSGKTLYCVNHFFNEFFTLIGGVPTHKKKFRLVSNIDGLTLPHVDLDEELKNTEGGVKKYFSRLYQEKLFEEHGQIVYMIDEAQFKFDRKFYDVEVFGWFQYHRHYGQTIYLMTQNAYNLPKEVQYCAEFIVRAQPRSKSLISKYFHYLLLSDGQVIGTDKVLGRDYLFAMYKTAKAAPSESIRRPFLKTMFMVGLFAICSSTYGCYRLTHKLHGNSSGDPAVSSVPTPSLDHGQTVVGSSLAPPSVGGDHASPIESNIETYSWQKVSHLIDFRRSGPVVRLMYHGVWSLGDFPYKLELRRGVYYAYVPDSDLVVSSSQKDQLQEQPPVSDQRLTSSDDLPSNDNNKISPTLYAVGGSSFK